MAGKEAQVAIAELIARGLVEQLPTGIRPTDKGIERAAKLWANVADTDKLLLIPYLRKQLQLVYRDEDRS